MDAHIVERRDLAPLLSAKDSDHLCDVAYKLGKIPYARMLETAKRFREYCDCIGDCHSEPDYLYSNLNSMVNGAQMTTETKLRSVTNRRDLSLDDQLLFANLCSTVANVMEKGMQWLLPCDVIISGVKHTVDDVNRVFPPLRQRLTWSILQ